MPAIHSNLLAPVPAPMPCLAAASTAARAPKVIAIASGKGGVGKTWLAISMAQSLAAGGSRVLLFDCDFGLANVDIQLGLTPKRDLAAVLSGRAGLEEVILAYQPPDQPAATFDILPGRSGAGSLATLDASLVDRLLQAIRRLQRYDIVLLDLGAGIDPAVRSTASAADTLLVVSVDEPTALTDAYAVVKLHARDRQARIATGSVPDVPADVRIVINQASSQANGRRTYDVLARACGTFLGNAPALAGVIRRDARVPDAIRRQLPLLTRHPNAPAAEDVRRVARAVSVEVGVTVATR